MKKLLELAAASARETPSEDQHDSAPRVLNGWRTVKQIRAELQFPSDAACRDWLRREGIAGVRRGRVILVDSLDIDAALRRVDRPRRKAVMRKPWLE